jgi:hypothetical protein
MKYYVVLPFNEEMAFSAIMSDQENLTRGSRSEGEDETEEQGLSFCVRTLRLGLYASVS